MEREMRGVVYIINSLLEQYNNIRLTKILFPHLRSLVVIILYNIGNATLLYNINLVENDSSYYIYVVFDALYYFYILLYIFFGKRNGKV